MLDKVGPPNGSLTSLQRKIWDMEKPAWLKLYEAAVLETDKGVLRERVNQAEQAVAARLNELSLDDAATSTERTEIEKVAKALRVLREERL